MASAYGATSCDKLVVNATLGQKRGTWGSSRGIVGGGLGGLGGLGASNGLFNSFGVFAGFCHEIS